MPFLPPNQQRQSTEGTEFYPQDGSKNKMAQIWNDIMSLSPTKHKDMY